MVEFNEGKWALLRYCSLSKCLIWFNHFWLISVTSRCSSFQGQWNLGIWQGWTIRHAPVFTDDAHSQHPIGFHWGFLRRNVILGSWWLSLRHYDWQRIHWSIDHYSYGHSVQASDGPTSYLLATSGSNKRPNKQTLSEGNAPKMFSEESLANLWISYLVIAVTNAYSDYVSCS